MPFLVVIDSFHNVQKDRRGRTRIMRISHDTENGGKCGKNVEKNTKNVENLEKNVENF